jgi:RNAse (barnase) inhibitor barstar
MSLAEAVRFVERPEHSAHAYEADGRITTDAELFRAVATALELDEEFGANWDALIDSLRDVTPKHGDTVTLFVHHAEELWTKAPRVAARLVEIWLLVADDMSTEGVEYRLVFVWP